MRKLVEFIGGLGKNLFTGQLIVNFHKGVGNVQISKTIKSEQLDQIDSKDWLKMH